MNKKLCTAMAILALSGLSTQALAQEGDIYGGIGVSSNDIGGPVSSSTGWQIFGGYVLHRVDDWKFAIEAGYMDTGNFNGAGSASGIWSTGVASLHFHPSWHFIGRLGLDFGDDDGLMAGIGIGHSIGDVGLRLEVVSRDNVDSVQFNALLRF
jgi:hypothetical protein